MTDNAFDASVRRRDGVAIIDLAGNIDGMAESLLTKAYQEATEDGGTAQVALNFSAVDYINSTGIALVVGLLAQARRDRRAVAAYGLSPHYLEIFQITRLADFMLLAEDEERAVAGAAEPATS
jgi:anti-anti-sigma factor